MRALRLGFSAASAGPPDQVLGHRLRTRCTSAVAPLAAPSDVTHSDRAQVFPHLVGTRIAAAAFLACLTIGIAEAADVAGGLPDLRVHDDRTVDPTI